MGGGSNASISIAGIYLTQNLNRLSSVSVPQTPSACLCYFQEAVHSKLEKDTAERDSLFPSTASQPLRFNEHLHEASVRYYVCWVTRSVSDFLWLY